MIDVFGKLCDALGPETVKAEEPMRHHTTFRIGGPAEIFAEPESTKALAEAVTICRQAGKPFYLLGNGSNLLVSDDGWRGVVISTGRLKTVRSWVLRTAVRKAPGMCFFSGQSPGFSCQSWRKWRWNTA